MSKSGSVLYTDYFQKYLNLSHCNDSFNSFDYLAISVDYGLISSTIGNDSHKGRYVVPNNYAQI